MIFPKSPIQFKNKNDLLIPVVNYVLKIFIICGNINPLLIIIYLLPLVML
jgi:hypothetical protein